MAQTTLIYSILYILIGLAGFLGTGAAHFTALIPAIFGVLLLICAQVAKKDHLRMHAMHAAVLIGLLGFLGTASSLTQIGSLASAERPAAVLSKFVTCLLSASFVALCVHSFIKARKARESGSK